MKRTPMKRHRPKGPAMDVRRAVGERSAGWCEIRRVGCEGRATHYHHKKRRSQGGQDTPENLLNVCAACHQWIHHHPREAQENGWLLESWRV